MPKTNDPQTIVRTQIKTGSGSGGELITFSLRLGWFQLVAIVPIPDEGQTEGKAYIKYKILGPNEMSHNRDDRNERTTEETA